MKPTTIYLDDEHSWPNEIVKLLESKLALLRSFGERELQIHRSAQDDVLVRINPPTNEYWFERESIAVNVGQLLEGRSIIGWHCTRLCDDEVASLRRAGMYPLSPETLSARLQHRIDNGDIPSSAASRFASEHDAKNIHRQMLWFIFDRKCLRDESGVGRFFASWGGEALYNHHEDDSHTGPILRSIGQPRIVEASLPLKSVDVPELPGEWFVRAFLDHRDIQRPHDARTDGHVRVAVPPEDVCRVFTLGESDFEILTGASRWRRYPLARLDRGR